MTKSVTRLYVIETQYGERLVDARSIVSATQHVMRDLVVARVADVRDVARLIQSGVKIESALGDAAPETEPPSVPTLVAQESPEQQAVPEPQQPRPAAVPPWAAQRSA